MACIPSSSPGILLSSLPITLDCTAPTSNATPNPSFSFVSNSPSPPFNIQIQIHPLADGTSALLNPEYSVDIAWEDPSAAVQGIQLMRTDIPNLIESQFPKFPPQNTPSYQLTTVGWLLAENKLDASGNILLNKNKIISNLIWEYTYTFGLRTVFFGASSGSFFSEWQYVQIYNENLVQRRKDDKCKIIPIETLENRLEPNLSGVPKAYRYSRIVNGGGRQVICQTWRPKGWKNGYFDREAYPILHAQDLANEEAENTNPGKAICSGAPCSQITFIAENIIISPYTGKAVFKSDLDVENLQIIPCSNKISRRIGSKLPIN